MYGGYTMVCPKLSDGNCQKLQVVCPQNYDLKMINFEKCSVYKKSGGLLRKVSGNVKVSKISRKSATPKKKAAKTAKGAKSTKKASKKKR
jgi:hypothetical protein